MAVGGVMNKLNLCHIYWSGQESNIGTIVLFIIL